MKKSLLNLMAPLGALLLVASPAFAQQKKVAIANMGPHG